MYVFCNVGQPNLQILFKQETWRLQSSQALFVVDKKKFSLVVTGELKFAGPFEDRNMCNLQSTTGLLKTGLICYISPFGLTLLLRLVRHHAASLLTSFFYGDKPPAGLNSHYKVTSLTFSSSSLLNFRGPASFCYFTVMTCAIDVASTDG